MKALSRLGEPSDHVTSLTQEKEERKEEIMLRKSRKPRGPQGAKVCCKLGASCVFWDEALPRHPAGPAMLRYCLGAACRRHSLSTNAEMGVTVQQPGLEVCEACSRGCSEAS